MGDIFNKTQGDPIFSDDWNRIGVELEARVNKAGDHMTGPLTIDGNVSIGTTESSYKLEVKDRRYGIKSEVESTRVPIRGIYGIARGTSLSSATNYGVYGEADGVNFSKNYGVYGMATGSGTKYGIYGTASGGGTNWAGYFDGDVRTTRSLTVGPFSVTNKQGRIDVTGEFAEFSFVRRSLTSWPVSPQAGDRFVWYNQDGSARLWTHQNHDLLTVTSDGRVGIGTTEESSTYRLEVSDTCNGIRINVNGSGYQNQWGIYSYVSGQSQSGNKVGVYGYAYGQGDKNYGVLGKAFHDSETDKHGARGYAYGSHGNKYGVSGYAGSSGQSQSGNKYGVYGYAEGSQGINYSIYGKASDQSGTNFAGWFQGAVHIAGFLSKGSGAFLIDHPLDPLNKTLRHNFVESPESLCLYRGKAKLNNSGKATVKMPAYFEALTKEDEATVHITPIGKTPCTTSYEWNKKYTAFTIFGASGIEVAYLVLANRDDPVFHQLFRPVEEEKGSGNFEKNKLIYPEAYGYPKTMSIQGEEEIERELDIEPGPIPDIEPENP